MVFIFKQVITEVCVAVTLPGVTLQVRNATERALFEARRREVEEERRVETALLQKAIELKDRAASQRQTLAAAAREGRQIQSR